MNVKNLFISFIIFLLLSSPLPAKVTEEKYSALLFINQVYQVILTNYYKPPSGVLLLKPAIKVLALETGKEITFSDEGLNNAEALKEFNRIFFQFTDNYSKDLHNLSINMCETMISSLSDKYSCLLEREDYTNIQGLLSEGKGWGLGFSLAERGGFVYVATVFPDTPAFSAGIKPEDIILEVNGTSVGGFSLNKVYSLLSGKAGEDVSLKLSRDRKILAFHVTGAEFSVKEITMKELSDNILYVKIYIFSNDIREKFLSELKTFETEHIRGIILDLRDNPGGDFQSAVNFAKIFLSSEPIIIIDSNKARKIIYGDNPSPLTVPVVALINNGTMSSAEIVASALQQSHRALLVGEKSFGKGVIQGLFPLDCGIALKLTIKQFLSVSGEAIDNIGVNPDVKVDGIDEQLLKATELIKNHN